MLRLRQAQLFLAVLDTGTVRAAAHQLALSQSAVSQALSRMEQEMGSPLFLRIGHSLVPSPAGRALAGPARRLSRDALVLRSLATAGPGATGQLEIACEPALSVEPAARLIGVLRRRAPGIRVSITEPISATHLSTLVRDGTCEVGVSYRVPSQTELEFLPLGQHALFLVLPPSTAPTASNTVTLPEIEGLRFIAVPRGHAQRDFVDEHMSRAGVRTHLVVETAHRDQLLPLVMAGVGATILPGRRAQDAAGRGAVVRKIWPPLVRKFGLVYRRTHHSSELEFLIDTVRDGAFTASIGDL